MFKRLNFYNKLYSKKLFLHFAYKNVLMNYIKIENILNKTFILFVLFLSIVSTSCNKDDEPIPQQEILDYERSGILGGVIVIEGKNMEFNKLQVFFDLQEASIFFVSENQIEVRVPRSIERYNPVLRVINLNTNEDILNESFVLKTPKINSFESNEITFDEKLIIYGENFDDQEEYLEVFVNNEKAQVLNATQDQLEVYIPTKIMNASLDITVKAQLQTTNASPNLTLRHPEISEITNNIAWLGGDLYVNGANFNPKSEYGEVYINGVKSHFSSSNTGLSIDIPYGPYSDFKITNITYKTAGLIHSYDINIEIGDIGIMVDKIHDIASEVIVYKNKGYAITADHTGSLPKIGLKEFDPVTEKWTKINSFEFEGYLNEIVFDNINSIYFYKGTGTTENINELVKLNLDTFVETTINFPFHKSLLQATFLFHKNDLFVLNGVIYENDQSIDSNKRYQYITEENRWIEITSDLFSGNDWKKGQIQKSIHFNNNLYFSYYDSTTHKLDDNSLLTQVYGGDNILFAYNQSIIGRRTNIVDQRMLLYNIFDFLNGVELQFGKFGSSVGRFFTINNKIYYHAFAIFYDEVKLATYRIKKEKLNEIL